MSHARRPRPRPTPGLLASLREGKAALHRHHASLPLRDKVEMVLQLQRLYLPLIERQRELESWEHPWAITP